MKIHTRRKIVLTLTLLVSLVGFGFMFDSFITPDMHRSTDPGLGVGYVYVHDDDEKVGRQHIVQGDFWSFNADDPVESVVLCMRRKGETADRRLPLARAPHCARWAAPLGLKRGRVVEDNFTGGEIRISDRYLFTIEIATRSGKKTVVRPPRNWLERLFGWAKAKRFKLTFEGEVSRFWLIAHIVLMMAAPVFLLHGVYYAVSILAGVGDPLPRLRTSLLLGFICFFVSAIPIGIIVTGQAFNVGFEPWPIGGDITDTKSLALVLLWLGILVGCRKARERTWAVATLVAALVSVGVYFIPHSMIVQ
jgi:hypothetical protein